MVGRWKGTVPWRVVMGALALVLTLSAFVVAPFLPGGSGPAPAAMSAQNLGAGSAAAADTVQEADAGSWTPQPATYGTGSLRDLPVTMADGTVLRADVYFPTTAGTSTAANGLFPVLLQQTPYGKAFIVDASAIANTNVEYLVDRGYIVVIADVRGTGDSGGSFDLFDPVQSTDGATLARWAAHLPQSNGEVGLFGESYMGINQFQTVEAAGAGSPIKAMFPIISGNDLYADTVTQGGIPDTEFAATYVALLSGLNLANPALEPLVEAAESGNSSALASGLAALAPTEAAHSPDLVSFLQLVLNVETGQGDGAFDDGYWAARSPAQDLAAVVKDQIPAFLVGGWNDLFEQGEPLNYVGLQNLFDGRPQDAAMTPDQAVTPRYQLLMGPWQHVTTGTGVNMSALELEWFDTWLLGEHTPMASTTTPLHLDIQNSGGSWVDAAQWPLPAATPTPYYFGAGRSGSDALSQQRRRPLAGGAHRGLRRRHGRLDGNDEPVRHPDGPVGRRGPRPRLPVARHQRPLRPQRRDARGRARRTDLHHGSGRLARGRGRADRRHRVHDLDRHRHRAGRHRRGRLPLGGQRAPVVGRVGRRPTCGRPGAELDAARRPAVAAGASADAGVPAADRARPGHPPGHRHLPDHGRAAHGLAPPGHHHDGRHAAPLPHADPDARHGRGHLPGTTQRRRRLGAHGPAGPGVGLQRAVRCHLLCRRPLTGG